jgi:hypothetical protein
VPGTADAQDACVAVTEARGPLGPRHRWSLWIDGRWPHPTLRFLEGAAPRDPPSVGVVRGVRTLHPRAVCRSLPPPARAARFGTPACGPALRGLVGANGWSSVSPRCAGGAAAAGRLVRPFHLANSAPSGVAGAGSRDGAVGIPAISAVPSRPGRSSGTSYLVDSASSHMLVSKIKPCMSKYKQLVL